MTFDFDESGSGPTLLFVPGSYSTSSAWKGVLAALQGTYRTISTSLPGYGGSVETRSDTVADMSAMTDFLARVVEHAGDGVHLVGHSFGGLTAVAATLSGQVSPLSLITFEANPVFSLPDTGRFAWETDIQDMQHRFERAVANGDSDAAGLIIDFWSQSGVFDAMPVPVKEFCRATAFTNVLDWRAAAGFTPRMSQYSAIDAPMTMVRGELAIQPLIEITDAIVGQAPAARLQVVPGAGHFLISTHADECARIIDDHMRNQVP